MMSVPANDLTNALSQMAAQTNNPKRRLIKPFKITVSNDKGGVGKTTTVTNLAAWLAHAGYRVLALDFDTSGAVASALRCKPDRGVYKAFIMEQPPENVIVHTPFPGIDIVPSNSYTTEVIDILGRRPEADHIIEIIDALAANYDFVIIDAPDKTGILRKRAFELADLIIIPHKAESKGLPAIRDLLQLARTDQQVIILPTMIKPRLKVHKETLATMEAWWKKHLIRLSDGQILIIQDSKYVPESDVMRQPLVEYAPDSEPATAYMLMSAEIIKRARTKYPPVQKADPTTEEA